MKILKAPEGLIAAPHHQSSLVLHGITAVEACTHVKGKKGSMFLDDHLLLFVLQGTYTIHYGKMTYTVGKHEMVLLKKAILIEYDKRGDPDNNDIAEYMMFFLKDEFLKDFVRMANIGSVQPEESVPVSVKPVKERLLKFFESLKPYFTEPAGIDEGLIRLKMLELLYDIADADKNLLQQLLQLKQQVRSDIPSVMEEHFSNPVSLSELAYLSGRSLSSFKRDFQSIYSIPPAQWIRERRLNKAKELLSNTRLSVSDVCYSTGFENLAHFSRTFKAHFGYAPSDRR